MDNSERISHHFLDETNFGEEMTFLLLKSISKYGLLLKDLHSVGNYFLPNEGELIIGKEYSYKGSNSVQNIS